MSKFNAVLSFALIYSFANAQDELEFSEFEISAKEIKAEDKAFSTPGAVSSRSDISGSNQSIDSIVRSMPGVYTNTDQSQGTVNVNIRGVSGFGRVNTMIDGVTQTYYGTSADSGSFHTGNGSIGTSNFGALIDPNFLIGVDTQRGTFSGTHGANSLMGSANFRTIGVDDVVRDGNNFGFLGKFSYGTNKLGPNYMGSVAAKFNPFENDDSLGFLLGYSGKKISQDYQVGGGGRIGDFTWVNPDTGETESAAPLDVKHTTQNPKSILFKTEFNDEFNQAILSYRDFRNTLAGRDITNQNYQLDYNFNANNDLLNLNFLIAYNNSKQKYIDGQDDNGFALATIFGRDISGLEVRNKALTLNLNNEMNFKFNDLHWQSKYGVGFLNNKYERDSFADYGGMGDYATPLQPRGKEKISTIFADNNFNYGIFGLETSLNLTKYEIKGHVPECDPRIGIFCSDTMPKDATISDTNLNYSILGSVEIHELFRPFISYSHSNRAPNIQEIFFSSVASAGDAMNIFLKPEVADTWQIGFNSHKQGFITKDDTFGFKALVYRSRVKDYIYNESLNYYTSDGDLIDSFTYYLNFPYKTTFKGFEAELSYDAGFFYAKASYARQTNNAPLSETYGSDPSNFGTGMITELPKDYATVNLGTRLLDEKVDLGIIAKYTGKAKRIYPSSDDAYRHDPTNTNDYQLGMHKTQDLPSIPTIYDLYVNFQPNKNLMLKFEVQNLTDKNYMDALNVYNSAANQLTFASDGSDIFLFNNSARGRTFIMGFQYQY